jgi:hypothetical protein
MYSIDFLNKYNSLKNLHLTLNGFVLFLDNSRYIKFTHLKESNMFFIEDYYTNDGHVFASYVHYISGKCYTDWLEYLNQINQTK